MTVQTTSLEQDAEASASLTAAEAAVDEVVETAETIREVLSARVGSAGTILLTIYSIVSSVLLIYLLVSFWPQQITLEGAQVFSTQVSLFSRSFTLDPEVRMLLIVIIAGALGGQVHTLRSLFWYIGNRQLLWSWVNYYILLPYVGSTLAVVFYLIIRGGFFSGNASLSETSPYSFAALAALTGMFSQSAAEKLKDVADTLLKKPPEGSDKARNGGGIG